MFKNMKIEVNEQQTIEDILNSLEVIGYAPHSKFYGDEICVLTQTDGLYCGDSTGRFNNGYKPTTLAELKEM